MNQPIRNILVATDFSAISGNILDVAIELCKQHSAVLHLLHVKESRYIVNRTAPVPALSILINEIDCEARNRLDEVYRSILSEHDISVQLYMPTGIPFDEICKCASEMPVDLIVMGTSGTTGVRSGVIGTTAYNVIKYSIKPVLTIPPHFKATSFKKILFPVRALQDVKAKYDLVKPLLATATISFHFDLPGTEGENHGLLFSKQELNDIMASLHANVIYSKESHAGVSLATEVLETAKRLAFDLIAINASLSYEGTQFFIADYTRHIINASPVPILSFRNGVNLSGAINGDNFQEMKIQV